MSKTSIKAYETIRKMILSGEFPPGLHLKEEELAVICGVSRTPIRDALRALAADDYVHVKPNHGTYVTLWSANDIDEIFKLRAVLEGMAAGNAAEHRTQDQIDELEKQYNIIDALLASSKKFDESEFLKANRRFHEVITAASQSQRLATMITRLVEQPVVARTAFSYKREDLKRSNAHHKEIIEALKVKDAQWADAVMQSHILAAYQTYKRHYEDTKGEDPDPSGPV